MWKTDASNISHTTFSAFSPRGVKAWQRLFRQFALCPLYSASFKSEKTLMCLLALLHTDRTLVFFVLLAQWSVNIPNFWTNVSENEEILSFVHPNLILVDDFCLYTSLKPFHPFIFFQNSKLKVKDESELMFTFHYKFFN